MTLPIPGRVGARGDHSFTLLVTPEQWEHVLRHHVGDDVDLYFADLLGPRDEDETFAVFDVFYAGDLVRSTREKLPPVRGRAFERRMAQLRANHPDGEFGWSAHPPEGPQLPSRLHPQLWWDFDPPGESDPHQNPNS